MPNNPSYFSISQLLFLHKDWLLCWSEAKVVSGRMIGFLSYRNQFLQIVNNAHSPGILLRRIFFSGSTIKKNIRGCSGVSDFCTFVKMAMQFPFKKSIDDLQKT